MLPAVDQLSGMVELISRLPVSIAFLFLPLPFFESAVFQHALKTPLMSLGMALADAQKYRQDPRRLQLALKQAQAAQRRLYGLIILAPWHQRGSFRIQQSILSVTRVFRDLGQHIEILMKSKQVSRVRLRGNPLLFEQLLEILIANSVRASSLTASVIVLSLAINRGALQIGIHDFGRGMSGLDVLLSQTYGHTTKTEGSGVGLAYARRIVAQFHGQLRIYSLVNIGTHIICTIPLDL